MRSASVRAWSASGLVVCADSQRAYRPKARHRGLPRVSAAAISSDLAPRGARVGVAAAQDPVHPRVRRAEQLRIGVEEAGHLEVSVRAPAGGQSRGLAVERRALGVVFLDAASPHLPAPHGGEAHRELDPRLLSGRVVAQREPLQRRRVELARRRGSGGRRPRARGAARRSPVARARPGFGRRPRTARRRASRSRISRLAGASCPALASATARSLAQRGLGSRAVAGNSAGSAPGFARWAIQKSSRSSRLMAHFADGDASARGHQRWSRASVMVRVVASAVISSGSVSASICVALGDSSWRSRYRISPRTRGRCRGYMARSTSHAPSVSPWK